jgi:hypothetical protein
MGEGAGIATGGIAGGIIGGVGATVMSAASSMIKGVRNITGLRQKNDSDTAKLAKAIRYVLPVYSGINVDDSGKELIEKVKNGLENLRHKGSITDKEHDAILNKLNKKERQLKVAKVLGATDADMKNAKKWIKDTLEKAVQSTAT